MRSAQSLTCMSSSCHTFNKRYKKDRIVFYCVLKFYVHVWQVRVRSWTAARADLPRALLDNLNL